MSIRIAISLISLAWLVCWPINALARSYDEQSLQVGDQQRWFIAALPENAKDTPALVLLLHGGTEDMRKTLRRPAGKDWIALSEQHGFLLIAPNGANAETGETDGKRNHWNDYREPVGGAHSQADDVAFILALIDWAVETHNVDRSRVYVVGGSNGGMMTYRLLAEAPDAFAGAAAFIANLPAKTPDIDQQILTPIMLVNGTDDPLMKWEGGMVGARGQQDVVLSVDETRNWWLEKNAANSFASSLWTEPDRSHRDNCRIHIAEHLGGDGGAAVSIVTLDGGGHAVPSRSHRKRQGRLMRRIIGTQCRDANGADLAWGFFVRQ